VEILADAGADDDRFGAYFLFVKWARLGTQAPEGHVESEYIAFGHDESEAVDRAGALELQRVWDLLEQAIRERRGAAPARRWFDAMRADDADADGASGGGA
jgi:hypothetical protein